MVAVEKWHAELARQGGTAAGAPRVTREPNPGYGLVVIDSDGEPVIDHDKLFIYVKGWATTTTRRGKL